MDIHIVLGIYKGVIDEVRATLDEDKAIEIEKELCNELEVPFDPEERQEFYETADPGHNEVYLYNVEAE